MSDLAEAGYPARAAARLPTMLEEIQRLVRVETPSADLEAVAAGARAVADLIAGHLGSAPRTEVADGVTHLVWRGSEAPPRVVLLCHQDTVWPVGTLERLGCGVEDGVLRGPGCFDMLTGLVMGVHALALAAETLGPAALAHTALLVTGDEERGSPTSRELILRECAGAEAVLVLEASAGPDGDLKTGRKGVSLYRLTVEGRAAHAGLEPERGVNAGVELAHQVLALAALGDPDEGTTVTPTRSSAGTTSNTVPAQARLDVDVRARTVAEQERVDLAVRALEPVTPGARLVVDGGPNRPPLEEHHALDLYARYRRVASALGVAPPSAVHVGGASDGNLTAGAGLATLDGLGAVGGGAHAEDEHVLVEHVAPRTAVLAALVHDLLDGGRRRS